MLEVSIKHAVICVRKNAASLFSIPPFVDIWGATDIVFVANLIFYKQERKILLFTISGMFFSCTYGLDHNNVFFSPLKIGRNSKFCFISFILRERPA